MKAALSVLLFILHLNSGCTPQCVPPPRTEIEKIALSNVLVSAEEEGVSLPFRYAFRMTEVRWIAEMKPPQPSYYFLEVHPKGSSKNVLLQATLDVTNLQVVGFRLRD